MVVEHIWRSTWTRPVRELRDAPLRGCWGETMELEGREPTMNTPLHLSRHPNGIHEIERFWFKEHRNWVRRYDITQHWGSTKSWTEQGIPEVEKDSVYFLCMIRWDGNEMMSIYPRVCRIYTPHHSVHLGFPCITVHPPSLQEDVLGGWDQANLEMHLEARSSELRDSLGGWNWVSLEIHLETEIGSIQKCTWRPRLREFGDSLGGRDRMNSQMHLEAMHQQNLKWFGSHNSTTQLCWTAPPILPEAPRSSWTGWMQNDVPLRCSSMLLK